jgi:large subunit GTPase 1
VSVLEQNSLEEFVQLA